MALSAALVVPRHGVKCARVFLRSRHSFRTQRRIVREHVAHANEAKDKVAEEEEEEVSARHGV